MGAGGSHFLKGGFVKTGVLENPLNHLATGLIVDVLRRLYTNATNFVVAVHK